MIRHPSGCWQAGVILLCAVTWTRCHLAAAAPRTPIDPTTLRHKVMCGYQGWFRCPGDSTEDGWKHWSRDGAKIGPNTMTFEMWPDLTEYDDDEKYAATGFTHPGGKPAHLFSSAHPKTIRRHFDWMQTYGIDGVFLQRFLVEARRPSLDLVLSNVRSSAAETGRVFAICYDLSGMPRDRIYDRLVADWKTLVDERELTKDPQYLHHEGKRLLFVWGFFSDRFDAALAHRIIDIFKNDSKYGATLIGGCQWNWRNETNPEWARAFRRLDVISPWNVGNVAEVDGRRHASTGTWGDDLAEAKRVSMDYLPVVYPGFGWTNLKGPAAARQTIPRLGGEFYWRQFSTAAGLGIDMTYVAMFDEVDEATAILKVSNSPPTPGRFQTYEGLPSDWYLRLTGEGSKLIRGERPNQVALPINRDDKLLKRRP